MAFAFYKARWLHFGIMGNHFGTSGAPWGTILASRPNPGWPWEQQDGDEVVRNRIFIDFEVILGPLYISFLVSRSSKFHFCSGLFPGHFFIGFWVEMSTLRTPKSRFSQGKYCQNQLFTEIVFFMNFGTVFGCFLEALEAVYSVFFLCVKNKLKNHGEWCCESLAVDLGVVISQDLGPENR